MPKCEMKHKLLSAVLIVGTIVAGMGTASGGSIVSKGKLTVTTAGTPRQLSTTSLPVYSLMIQAAPDNSGTYMILKDAAGNIICKASKGQSCSPPMPKSGIDLQYIQLDTDTNGDGAYVSYATES